MQELAIDFVVQEDAEVLVGSSRGASSSTPCFPQAGKEGRQRERAGLFGLVVGDFGRQGTVRFGRAPHGIPRSAWRTPSAAALSPFKESPLAYAGPSVRPCGQGSS